MVSKKTVNSYVTPASDKVLYAIVDVVFMLFLIIILYPIIFVLSASFSSGAALDSGRVILWPVEPTIEGYKAVFAYNGVVSGYRNSIFYTVMGTAINVVVTLLAAYPLTRSDFPARKFFMMLCTITMFFGGGLVPFYILMVDIRMINTIWAILLPGSLSVYNMILVRTNMISTIPKELFEAARIDGCNDTRYFFNIVLPLSKAVIAVITLYYAVGHWNSYFNAMIFLRDRDLFPLQLILREILVSDRLDLTEIVDPEVLARLVGLENLLKYALIVVSSIPMVLIYPFIQKFFIKGVMIGSLKG